MGSSNCGGCGSCWEEESGFSDRSSLTSSSCCSCCCSRTSLNRCSKDGSCSYDDDDEDDANKLVVNNFLLLQENVKVGGRAVVVDFISIRLVVALLRVTFVVGRNATTSDEIISMERIHIITTRL